MKHSKFTERRKKRAHLAREDFLKQWKRNKMLVLLYFALRLIVIVIGILQFWNRDYANVFACVLTLVLFMIPSFFEKKIKIDVPDTLEIIILLFIFAAEILGEIREYYISFPHWDTLLHTTSGFLMAAIGLSMVYLLNESRILSHSLSPLFVSLVAFCFSMTLGVFWEFFEFGMDFFFSADMQKDTWISVINTVSLHPESRNIVVSVPIESVVVNGDVWPLYLDIGLIDTMKDLFVNFIGAAVFSVFGVFLPNVKRQETWRKNFVLSKIEDTVPLDNKSGSTEEQI